MNSQTSSNNFSMKASLPYIFEHWSPHISLENTDPLYGPPQSSLRQLQISWADRKISCYQRSEIYQRISQWWLRWRVTDSNLILYIWHPSSDPVHYFLLILLMEINDNIQFSSVQFSCSVVSNSLWPHELQHARPPCPSPTSRVHSDSRPSSQWCHPAISSSVIPFSSCPQSLPESESSNESALHMKWPQY